METFHSIFEIAFPLFLIMDPIANSTATLAILKNLSPWEQKKVIFRELLIALLIMLVFQFLGEALLKFLDINQSTLKIAGGIILFIISLKLIFPEEQGRIDKYEKDPFIVPIATPFISGPTLLAAIILYSNQVGKSFVLISALLLAWFFTLVIMLLATNLSHILGDKGSKAAERLMGLILILLAVQMLEEGVYMFLKNI